MTFIYIIAYKTIHNLILHTFIVTSLSTTYKPIPALVPGTFVTAIVITVAVNLLSTYYVTTFHTLPHFMI